MLRSMTGFGAASNDGPDYSFRVELRSVNHRHLLVKSRLPSEFLFLEGEIERLVRKRLDRGVVSVHLHAAKVGSEKAAQLDLDLVRRYKQDLDRIAEAAGLPLPVRLETLITLPGVIRASAEDQPDTPGHRRRVMKLVGEAITRLSEMRAAEGAALADDLRKHTASLLKLVKRIEKRMPKVVRGQQAKLRKRLAELLDRREEVPEADVAREIALLADRADVSEELSRLESHLEQLDGFVERGGSVGRKLDFLVQEVFREVNTIGSKCNDAQVAHWVVEGKVHAERLREQVQNVE